MRRIIELLDQDYQYCLDYVSGKTNIMALNNINRVIKAVVNGIPQADYEARLKAEKITMLEELKVEIEELPMNKMAITDSSGLICYGYSECRPTAKDVNKVIQQKINSLKDDKI